MNSRSANAFDFDLGIGSNRSKSLTDQKNQTSSYSSYSVSSSSTQSKPAWQPNKPSWTHSPAPTQASRPGLTTAPTSMVGDILGKSWTSTGPSGSGIGIVDKNPNLFGDLLGSALGHGKSNSNVPLKNATPASNKNAYSMGNLNNSLPKTSNSVQSSGNRGSYSSSNTYSNNKSTNLGGPSMKTMAGGAGIGGGIGSNKDPFGSLVDFGSKQSGSLNSSNKGNKVNAGDDAFGDFQDAPKSSTNVFRSNASNAFGDFQNAPKSGTNAFQSNATANSNNFMGSNMGFDSNMSDFGIPTMNSASQNQNQNPVQSSNVDPLDSLFSSTSASTGGFGGQQSADVVDDWGLDSEFGGNGSGGGTTTTELEGLPPPPAGVTAPSAKNKGMDNYKQGQYADAIKWLSWAVILLEKAGDDTAEVLTSRASCYKEVGEYKKAVADCSKVLEQDEANVSVLVQRALLYESMEKYRLGAEDLRTVLRIDPSNRIARSTVHRLTKMAG